MGIWVGKCVEGVKMAFIYRSAFEGHLGLGYTHRGKRLAGFENGILGGLYGIDEDVYTEAGLEYTRSRVVSYNVDLVVGLQAENTRL